MTHRVGGFIGCKCNSENLAVSIRCPANMNVACFSCKSTPQDGDLFVEMANTRTRRTSEVGEVGTGLVRITLILMIAFIAFTEYQILLQ